MSEETYTVILNLKNGDALYPQDSPLIFRQVGLLISQTLGAYGSGYEYNYLMACDTVLSYNLNMEPGSSSKTLTASSQAAYCHTL